jgi:hypothetical protein
MWILILHIPQCTYSLYSLYYINFTYIPDPVSPTTSTYTAPGILGIEGTSVEVDAASNGGCDAVVARDLFPPALVGFEDPPLLLLLLAVKEAIGTLFKDVFV